MPYGDSSVVVETSWPQARERRGFALLPLVLATALSFAAGVGSTVVYLQTVKDEIPLASLPLIEADKAPTKVRPEGFEAARARLAQAVSPGLPLSISSAMAAVADPLVELTPQGIPQAPELAPPAAAAVIELAPAEPKTMAAPAAVKVEVEPANLAGPQFQLQLASMRTPEGAREEAFRLKRLHGDLLESLELTVQRIDQGVRGVFYRVLSGSVGGRPEASELCSTIAQKRGQCAVVALAGRPAEARMVAAASPSEVPVQAPKIVPPALPAAVVATPAPPAATTQGSEVRVQLGSLRSMEGATREVARLSHLYGAALGPTELTVSRIDQGERGVFYRILTAPLPSRETASDLCQRLSASQAGCVLLPLRPTA